MRYLRTNTAVRLTVGPFFDKADGVTPETALTVTSCKLTLMVDDGNVPTLVLDTAPTASGGANDMVHVTGDDAGFYDLELAAGNVNYLGRAMLAITDAATHCPVFHEFMILPAMIYDAMVLGTDDLDCNVTKWLGTAAATPTVAGVPEVDVTHLLGTAWLTPGTAGTPDVNMKLVGGQTASASGTVTFPNATLASTTNITAGTITTTTNLTNLPAITANWLTAAGIAADAGAEIADAVWDEAASGHTTSGTFGEQCGTDIDAILVDTGTTLDGRIPAALVSGRMDSSVGAMAANVLTAAATAADFGTEIAAAVWDAATSGMSTVGSIGKKLADWSIHSAADVWSVATRVLTAATNITSTGGTTVPQTGDSYAIVSSGTHGNAALKTLIDAVDDYIDSEVAAIKAKTDNLPADPADASDVAAAIAALSVYTTRIVARCTVGAASSTTSIVTSACSPSGAVADQFKGRIVVFDNDTTTAALRGQATDITASSNSATPTLTVTALTTAPASGDTFSIV